MPQSKILSLFLSFCLILEQSVFAQTIDLSRYFVRNSASAIPQSDKFRPLHLRYISYDNQANDFKILLDKGDSFNQKTEKPKNEKTLELEKTTQELMKYFFIGLALPNEKFWVNLRPDSPDDILDPDLEKTDIGRIFLEADVQLKQDTAGLTSPQTKEGKEYWDKLYKKAGELFGTENITIPTITRPWIVPDEVILRESPEGAYIYKATLKVMLEEDYLRGTKDERRGTIINYSFKDPRLKELNEYSTKLIKESIIPRLTQEMNSSRRYAPLRQVYYSLILAQWFKQKYGSLGSARATGISVPVNNYIDLIDSGNLANLASSQPYDKQAYFRQYQQSFKDGEYNLREPVYTPMGQSIRRYMSGGLSFVTVSSAITPIQASGDKQIGNNTFSYIEKCRVIGASTSNFEVQIVSSPLQKEVKKQLFKVITELRNGRKSLVGKIPFLTKEIEAAFRSGGYAVIELGKSYRLLYTSGKRERQVDKWKKIGLSNNPSDKEKEKTFQAYVAWQKIQVSFPEGNLQEAFDSFKNTIGKKYGITLRESNITIEDAQIEERYSYAIDEFYEITAGDIYAAKELLELLPEKLLKSKFLRKVNLRMPSKAQGGAGGGEYIKENGEVGIIDNPIKFDRYMMAAVLLHEMGHALMEIMTKEQRKRFELLFQRFNAGINGISAVFATNFLGPKLYRVNRIKSSIDEFFAENFMHFVILGEKRMVDDAYIPHRQLHRELHDFYKEFYSPDEFNAKFSEISSSSLTEEDTSNNTISASSAAGEEIMENFKETFYGSFRSWLDEMRRDMFEDMLEDKYGDKYGEGISKNLFSAYDAVYNVIVMKDDLFEELSKFVGMKKGIACNFKGFILVPEWLLEKLHAGDKEALMALRHEIRHGNYRKKHGEDLSVEQRLIDELYAHFISFLDVYGKTALAEERDTSDGKLFYWQQVIKTLDKDYISGQFKGDINSEAKKEELILKSFVAVKLLNNAILGGKDYILEYLITLDNLDALVFILDKELINSEIPNIVKYYEREYPNWVTDKIETANPESYRERWKNFEKKYMQDAKKSKSNSSPIADEMGGIDLSRINKSIRTENVSSPGASGGSSPVDVDFDLNEELSQLQKLLNAQIIPSASRLERYARAARASSASSLDSADGALSLVAETFRLQEEKAVPAAPELKALAAWLE